MAFVATNMVSSLAANSPIAHTSLGPVKGNTLHASDEFLGMRGAGQEGEIAGDAKFGIAHGNRPATYQAGGVRPGQVMSQSRGPAVVSTRQ